MNRTRANSAWPDSVMLCVLAAWIPGFALCSVVTLLNPRFPDSLGLVWAVFYILPGILAAGLGLLLGLVPGWRRLASAIGSKRAFGSRVLPLGLVAIGLLSFFPYLHARTRDPSANGPGSKIILIGLDGATWEMINPLREQGRLPNLSLLIESGAWGVLKSEEPTISPALWTTIATGKSRGKHGVANFFSTQESLEAKRVWEIIAESGRPVGVMSWMVTWPPPETLDGFWVPSHLARGPETVPQEMAFLPKLVGGTREGRDIGFFQRAGWGVEGVRHGLRLSTVVQALRTLVYETSGERSYLDANFRRQHLALSFHRDLFLSLRRRYRPAFSAIAFYGTDTLAHKYWRYFEPELFRNTDPSDIASYANVIPDYYEAADRAIGDIIRSADDETTIILVSDHGTKAMEGGAVVSMPRLAGEALAEKMGIRQRVDVTTVGNQVFMNLKDGPEEPDAVSLGEIAEMIRAITFVEGQGVPFNVQLIDLEGDSGDYVGIEFVMRATQDRPMGELDLELADGSVVKLGDVARLEFPISGTHHPNGVIILNGPTIRPGELPAARIGDVTPTILYLMDLPVASDMDGEVLASAILPSALQSLPVEFVDSYGAPAWTKTRMAERPLSEDVAEELRALGYIE